MTKRKQQENNDAASKRPRTEGLKFVCFHDRERTKKYVTDVKKGKEHEILLDFDKEEYLESLREVNDKEGHIEALRNDTGCLKHVMTCDGLKTGKFV